MSTPLDGDPSRRGRDSSRPSSVSLAPFEASPVVTPPVVFTRRYDDYVDSDDWQGNSPEAQAIRALADSAKSPQQQQAEADQARQREIDRIIDELGNMDIEGFAADKNRKRNRA